MLDMDGRLSPKRQICFSSVKGAEQLGAPIIVQYSLVDVGGMIRIYPLNLVRKYIPSRAATMLDGH